MPSFLKIQILSLVFILVSCGSDKGENLIAKGNKQYGGSFRFMSLEKVQVLFPLHSMDLYSQRLNTQIYETLFRESSNGNVVPHLVKSFHISKDKKIYTFELNNGVYFHENECFDNNTKKLTSKDVKFLLEFACSQSSLNHLSHLLVSKIQGSEEYYNNSKNQVSNNEISGIRIINESKFSIELTKPFAHFEKLLSHPSLGIFPEEALKKYGSKILTNPVGTGPFMLDKIDKLGITLKRNKNYWRTDQFGNKLPFLDQVVMKYAKDKNSELIAFQKNEIDIILEVPVENVTNLFGTLEEAQNGKTTKHKIFSQKSSMMNYLVFASDKEPFNNPDVRRAFLYAIDKEYISSEVLKGEGIPAAYGLIPNMYGYEQDSSVSIKFDPEKARNLMIKAGFPEGKNFPDILLWVNTIKGSSTNKWTEDITRQLKENIGVNVTLKFCSFEEKQEAVRKGTAVFWRYGWIPDYPDPESFLSVFYKKYASINSFWGEISFSNPEFDLAYEESFLEKDGKLRNKLLNRCNELLMKDAVVLPVFSDDFFVVLNLKVRDFVVNSIETIDLSRVFIKEI